MMIRFWSFCLIFLVLAGPPAFWWFALRPLPNLEGTCELPGLSKPVEVSFDAHDIPYLEAASDEDMYAAQGYLVARERMFQMEILRRLSKGRFAELFGIAALPCDRLMRTIGFERLADEELTHLSLPASKCLEAYCRGVNAYIEEYSDKLPVEFSLLGFKPHKWRAQDTLAICKYLAYELDESWKIDELRFRVINQVGNKLAQELFNDNLSCLAYSPNKQSWPTKVQAALSKNPNNLTLSNQIRQPNPLWGSSACALSGNLSYSRGALLAVDKHGAFTFPCDWFLCSMRSEQTHVAGVCIPGVPGIVFGRNDDIAWGSTALKADVQDLFAEHFDSKFSSQYETAQGKANAKQIREVIPVRFGKDVEHVTTVTQHGPVLFRDKAFAVALSWSGFETKNPWLNSLYKLNKAKDFEQFRQALQDYTGSPQLYIYADRRGNIGAQSAGTIPVRQGGADGTTMSCGWQNIGRWVGVIPFDGLPSTNMPKDSFCVASGQKLFSKFLLGHQWSPPYRANRLVLSLSQNKAKFGLLNLSNLQADQFHMLSTLVVNQLSKSCENTHSIEASQIKALSLMRKWDGALKAESPEASVFESFLITLAQRLLEPKLGQELTSQYLERWPLWITFVEHYLRDKPKDWLPYDERTFDNFMVTTFAKANTRLKLFFKNNNVATWHWQAIHQGTFQHIIDACLPWLGWLWNYGPIGLAGDSNTLNSCDVTASSVLGKFVSKNGTTVRFLVDMTDEDKCYANVAFGQSGHLCSSFRFDEFSSWIHCDPLPVAFSRNQIDKQASQKLYLSVSKGGYN